MTPSKAKIRLANHRGKLAKKAEYQTPLQKGIRMLTYNAMTRYLGFSSMTSNSSCDDAKIIASSQVSNCSQFDFYLEPPVKLDFHLEDTCPVSRKFHEMDFLSIPPIRGVTDKL